MKRPNELKHVSYVVGLRAIRRECLQSLASKITLSIRLIYRLSSTYSPACGTLSLSLSLSFIDKEISSS